MAGTEWKDGAKVVGREPRERVESTERPVQRLLRESPRDASSSYRMAPSDSEERVEVPTIAPPPTRRDDRDSSSIGRDEPTTRERAPRETRERHTPVRRRVSMQLAAAEAAAQRVIERAAKAHADDAGEPGATERPNERVRKRTPTIAGIARPDPTPPTREPERRRSATMVGLGGVGTDGKKNRDA